MLPGPEALLGKDVVDWIYDTVKENEKAIVDGRRGRRCDDSSVDYVIEVTEIDPDNKDLYQVLEQIEATSYSADIIRIEKEGEEREGGKKMLVGRVYL